MKKSKLEKIVREEIDRFIGIFNLMEADFKQESIIMPDEWTIFSKNLKNKDGYQDAEFIDKDGHIQVTLNNIPVMTYDKKTYTLSHDFLPNTILDLVKSVAEE